MNYKNDSIDIRKEEIYREKLEKFKSLGINVNKLNAIIKFLFEGKGYGYCFNFRMLVETVCSTKCSFNFKLCSRKDLNLYTCKSCKIYNGVR